MILWIASWYPHGRSPQDGDFVQRMGLAAARFSSIAVLVSEPSRRFGIKFLSIRSTYTEVRCHYPALTWDGPMHGVVKGVNRLFSFFALIFGYIYVRRKFGRPLLIHSHVIYPFGPLAALFSWFERLPLLVTEHWTGWLTERHCALQFRHKWASKLVFARAHVVTAVANSLRFGLIKAGCRVPVHLLSNVVQDSFFNSERKPPEGRFQFLFVGVLRNDIKNLSGILKALRQVANSNVRLTILGDGPDKLSNRILSRELGLDDYVSFEGTVDNDQVAHFMSGSHCLLLFSNFENQPCVILEALASGLPVIASRVGGVPDMVNENNGILVEPGDDEGLARAMITMIDNYSSYDREKIREDIRPLCSYESVGKQLDHLYRSVLTESH